MARPVRIAASRGHPVTTRTEPLRMLFRRSRTAGSGWLSVPTLAAENDPTLAAERDPTLAAESHPSPTETTACVADSGLDSGLGAGPPRATRPILESGCPAPVRRRGVSVRRSGPRPVRPVSLPASPSPHVLRRVDAGGAIRTRRCGSRSGIFPAAGRLRSHRTPDRGRGAGHRVEIAALEAFRVFLHNGNSQACVNLLEGGTLHDFHVHRATERYR